MKPRERERARARRPRVSRASLESLWMLSKGLALELRRRLRPVGRRLRPLAALIQAGLGRIAPPISRALLVAVALPLALAALLLDGVQALGRWTGERIGLAATAVWIALVRLVTPVRALAAVTAAAATLLLVSQFVDYRGVQVGEPQYRGEVGTVAEAPLTDREPAGSAHLYALAVLAIAALALTAATAAGRWRLGRAIGLIGLAGIAVGIAIDVPKGLDAGIVGEAYLGTEAVLLEGFWAQMSASAALLVCGPLLGYYVRAQAGERRQRARRAGRRLRGRGGDPTRAVAAGLGAGT